MVCRKRGGAGRGGLGRGLGRGAALGGDKGGAVHLNALGEVLAPVTGGSGSGGLTWPGVEGHERRVARPSAASYSNQRSILSLFSSINK